VNPRIRSGLVNFAIIISMIGFIFIDSVKAQPQLVPYNQIYFYTMEWEGDRDQYGRPFVAEEILKRMKYVGLEEAWGTIRGAGYHNKFEGNWHIMHPSQVMTGRAFTAAFLPASPELAERMNKEGMDQGLRGGANQWPIYMLQKGDVYVADGFGKINEGTLIGNNLGQAIYSNSGNGPVFYGSARDLGSLREIDGFNAWVKGWHPSYIRDMMLISINGPVRIGEAVALPGDVVLATEGGVVFIPPQLAERVIVSSEVERMTDAFRIQRIREGVYSLEETYGIQWAEAIEADFYEWIVTNRDYLREEFGVGEQTIDRVIATKTRNWQEWLEQK
jgi:4-hydroxy-4-methyl-2-oxoglutarate aldolase